MDEREYYKQKLSNTYKIYDLILKLLVTQRNKTILEKLTEDYKKRGDQMIDVDFTIKDIQDLTLTDPTKAVLLKLNLMSNLQTFIVAIMNDLNFSIDDVAKFSNMKTTTWMSWMKEPFNKYWNLCQNIALKKRAGEQLSDISEIEINQLEQIITERMTQAIKTIGF